VEIDRAQDLLGLRVPTRDLDRYLGPSPRGAHRLHFLPAFAGVAAPRWDDRARPGFAGDPRGATPRDRLRAVVESIACRCTEILRTADRSGSFRSGRKPILAAGGLTRCRTLIEAQADLVGRPVQVRDEPDATALGAARLAVAGADGVTQSRRMATGSAGGAGGSLTTIRPRGNRASGETWFRNWKKAVYGSPTRVLLRRPGRR